MSKFNLDSVNDSMWLICLITAAGIISKLINYDPLVMLRASLKVDSYQELSRHIY
jgi:hypothetical protein